MCVQALITLISQVYVLVAALALSSVADCELLFFPLVSSRGEYPYVRGLLSHNVDFAHRQQLDFDIAFWSRLRYAA